YGLRGSAQNGTRDSGHEAADFGLWLRISRSTVERHLCVSKTRRQFARDWRQTIHAFDLQGCDRMASSKIQRAFPAAADDRPVSAGSRIRRTRVSFERGPDGEFAGL